MSSNGKTLKRLTELEVCHSLGIIFDPLKNRVKTDADGLLDLCHLVYTFSEMTCQKKAYGTLNKDLWLEFVPWHSLN